MAVHCHYSFLAFSLFFSSQSKACDCVCHLGSLQAEMSLSCSPPYALFCYLSQITSLSSAGFPGSSRSLSQQNLVELNYITVSCKEIQNVLQPPVMGIWLELIHSKELYHPSKRSRGIYLTVHFDNTLNLPSVDCLLPSIPFWVRDFSFFGAGRAIPIWFISSMCKC